MTVIFHCIGTPEYLTTLVVEVTAAVLRLVYCHVGNKTFTYGFCVCKLLVIIIIIINFFNF